MNSEQSVEKKEFTFLTTVAEPELKLVLEKLRQAGIKYEVKDLPENAPWRLYGAQPLIGGRRIFVPSSEFERAKQILGLKNQHFIRRQFKHTPLGVRMFWILLIFGSLIIFILLSLLF